MNGRHDLAVAFVVATAIHVGALTLGPSREGGAGAGDGGADRMRVEAVSPALAALVSDWDRPPETSEPITLASPTKETSITKRPAPESLPRTSPVPPMPGTTDTAGVAPKLASALPEPPPVSTTPNAPTAPVSNDARPGIPSAIALPNIEPDAPDMRTAALPPPKDIAPRMADRPEPRPERMQPAAPEVTRRVATGVGNDGTAGTTRTAPSAKALEASQQAATSEWASAIQRRIGRHQAYPRGARAEGRVRVAMVVMPDGRLDRVSVVQSSGADLLDAAALAAVRSAAPFPPAPEMLTDKWFNVGQWITFERR